MWAKFKAWFTIIPRGPLCGRSLRRGLLNMKSLDKFIKDQRAKKVRYLINKYNLSLTRAICGRMNHAMSIAIDLMDINVIPERTYHEFSKTVNQCDPLTDMVFASSLMSRVRKALSKDPESFPVVMNSFRRHSLLNEVVVEMEKEYYEEKFYKTPKFILTVSVASSVLVGLLAIILAFVLWPSSSAIVQCTDGAHHRVLIQKLTSSDTSNLTTCWSTHEKGSQLLQEYKSWCNETLLSNTSETHIANETAQYLQDWCSIVESISENLSSAQHHQDTAESGSNTWCREDIDALLECLKSVSV